MPCHVKTIAGAHEVCFDDGTAAMIVIFTDGDYTWWVVEGKGAIAELKLRAGETVVFASEYPLEQVAAAGTTH